MKKLILILLVFPAFCFAQQDIPKPAVDDCPSFKKKTKENSKAEYLYFLRTNKAKDNLTVNTSSPGTNPTKTDVKSSLEENPFLIPRRPQKTMKTTSTPRYTDSKPEKTPSIVKEVAIQEPEVKKIVETQEAPIVMAPVEKEEVMRKKEIATAGGESTKEEKPKKEKKFKSRTSRSSGKVKSCKSGNASKCPDF